METGTKLVRDRDKNKYFVSPFCNTWNNESILIFFGTPYKIRTCDPRFRKPMLYPTELRAQLIYSRYLSQNMSICFLNPIYISRNLSVKRQMSDTRKSGITICNSNDSFFHVKYLVAIDSESHRLWVIKCSPAGADSRSLAKGVSKHALRNLNPY